MSDVDAHDLRRRYADARTTSIPLGPGDVLLLYTDGATDAPVGAQRRLEDEGLQAFVAAAPPKPAAVVDAVLLGVQGSVGVRRDDIALLAIGRQPTWQAAPRASTPRARKPSA